MTSVDALGVSPSGPADRILHGLRVSSTLAVPDLLPWTGDDRPPDLVIRLGEVPPRLEDPIVERPLLQVGRDGACRFAIPAVGAYLVSPDGREITIAPIVDLGAAEVRTFLFGTVFAAACMRRGLLPLHASCVRFGAKAVAFAGHSGAGKSTLAAMLLRRGYPLLADDMTVIDLDAPGGPMVLPGFPRVKLWRDAMDRLEFSAEGLERARPGLEKYHVPIEAEFCIDPLPLAGLVHIEARTHAPRGLRRLSVMDGLKSISSVLYRQQMMLRLGLQQQQMQGYAAILGAVGGLRALRRPESSDELDAVLPSLAALPG
jgi:hypothetical protein